MKDDEDEEEEKGNEKENYMGEAFCHEVFGSQISEKSMKSLREARKGKDRLMGVFFLLSLHG